MTAVQNQQQSPIAHLSPDDIELLSKELDEIRQDVLDSRGARDAAYIRRVIRVQRTPRARQPGGAAVLEEPARLDHRHHRPRAGQDPRQHGDRPQRPARPVGLDARPRHPLLDVGVGPRGAGGVLEALAQRAAPRLHQHPRQGQRPRLRHPARRRGPAVEAAAPDPAAAGTRSTRASSSTASAMYDLELGDTLREKRGITPEFKARLKRHPAQGPQAGHQGLPRAPCALGPVVPLDVHRQPDRQPDPQRVEPLGDHVRALPRRRRDVRAGRARPRRDPRGVVPPPDARLGQHLRARR